jgi:glycosyltransferase involved in cell wall biosynthesis
MRLLLVNYEYPPVGAGAATATQAIARNLVALGHSVTVLTGSFRDLPRRSDENGVTILRVRCLRRRADRCSVFEMFSFTVSALLTLPSVHRTAQPDALIVFFSFPTGPIGAAARSWYGLPYLVSLRGGDVPGLTPEVNWIHRLLAPIRRHILKHATAVVANAEGLRKLSEAIDPTRVHVIPNGVDTEFFQPAPAKSANQSQAGPFRILFVGRFQGQKNLPYLLQECSCLPPGSFELHLVGDGPLAAELRALAEELGLGSAIIWHGWLQRTALRDVYRSVDCFINPSLYEGLPNVVLEAMASALPVIASNIPGNDALVLPGRTGQLFELHQPGALFNTVKELMDDPVRSAQLGANGRARAGAEFSWGRVAEDYLHLLQK